MIYEYGDRLLEMYKHDCLLDAIPNVGWGMFYEAASGGPRPILDELEMYEICYLQRGSIDWWHQETLFEATSGYAFVNYPGEWLGGYNALVHPCHIYWVQIDFGRLTSPAWLLPVENFQLRSTLDQLKYRAFPVTAEMGQHFERLLSEYRERRANSSIVVWAVLHEIIVYFLRSHERFIEQEEVKRSSEIQTAVDWMNRHLADDYSLDEVAEIVNMSVGYFHRRFLNEVGSTPGDYRTQRRLRTAKQLLRDNSLSITRIAYSLGYPTSQYFATVFKQRIGITPSQYRDFLRHTS